MEVSVESEGGRLRPDAIVRIPGGKSLVIDAKVSMNAYQDAHGAVDETERANHMAAQVASKKKHNNQTGAKEVKMQPAEQSDVLLTLVPGADIICEGAGSVPP